MIHERQTIDDTPRVSVVMPTYNRAIYLREAVDSILRQTFSDFELIIINDGSTDDTRSILESYEDKRVRVFTQENQGVTRAFNRGFGLARGCYVAQMADDDISLAERLARQVCYLDQHGEVDIIGTTYEMMDSSGRFLGTIPVLCSSAWIHKELLFYSPFGAGSVMARKDVLLSSGGYNGVNEPAEDYALWLRIGRDHEMANLPQVLYRYRVHASSISAQRRNAQIERSNGISRSALDQMLSKGSCWGPSGNDPSSEKGEDIYRPRRERVYANVCFRLGIAYMLKRRQADARQEMRLAVRNAPERLDYWVGLASTFLPSSAALQLRQMRKYTKARLKMT